MPGHHRDQSGTRSERATARTLLSLVAGIGLCAGVVAAVQSCGSSASDGTAHKPSSNGSQPFPSNAESPQSGKPANSSDELAWGPRSRG
jgi:hypothetical protein